MSTASLTLFFQGFPAPQLYAAPGAWERGGCSKGWWQKGNSADFAFLLPWIKMGGGSKGRKPACFQPALPFHAFSGGKIHRAGNCLEAGKQERQEHGDGAPCSGQVSGSHRKSRRPGLNSFSLPPPSLMQTGLSGNTPGSPWAHKAGFGQGFLTLPCFPKEGSSRSVSLSSRN